MASNVGDQIGAKWQAWASSLSGDEQRALAAWWTKTSGDDVSGFSDGWWQAPEAWANAWSESWGRWDDSNT